MESSQYGKVLHIGSCKSNYHTTTTAPMLLFIRLTFKHHSYTTDLYANEFTESVVISHMSEDYYNNKCKI